MAHVVILGAGLGGTIQAYELKDTLTRSDKITVISNKPYFQFTPSNPWAGVGWRNQDDLTVGSRGRVRLPRHRHRPRSGL